jgi:hypothetical protein
MGSKSSFSRPHRTQPFDEPAAEHVPPDTADAAAPGRTPVSDEATRLFTELCERVPDAAERAALVGVSVEVDEMWRQGKALPVLRAHRKKIERALNAAPPAE